MTFNPVSLLYSLFYFPVIAVNESIKMYLSHIFFNMEKRKPNKDIS